MLHVFLYSADCAIKLIDKKADFGVFSAEDAFFVANQINDKVNVIGELRNIERWNGNYCFKDQVMTEFQELVKSIS